MSKPAISFARCVVRAFPLSYYNPKYCLSKCLPNSYNLIFIPIRKGVLGGNWLVKILTCFYPWNLGGNILSKELKSEEGGPFPLRSSLRPRTRCGKVCMSYCLSKWGDRKGSPIAISDTKTRDGSTP